MEQMDSGDAASLIQAPAGSQDDPEPSGHSYRLLFNNFSYEKSETIKSKQQIGKQTEEFRKLFYPHATEEQWNNWHWQIRNSITDYEALEVFFNDKSLYSDLIERKLPFRITPYYASVAYSSQSLQKTVIPSMSELILSKGESIDPLHEDHDRSAHCVVHRYPDRVLFLATNFCSTNCRYCTRSRIVASKNFHKKQITSWDAAFDYIRNHKEIRDVIISGGDPLTLSDISLEYILSNLRKISHIEIIRIGSKVPAVLPMRINRKLVKMLKKYNPLFLSLHFTHPDEITAETKEACNLLADNGLVMGSQTVLLNGVNDDPSVMKDLFHKLLMIRVKPYYLYQCDPVAGSSHFRTPVSKGIEIIEKLRGWTSGYAIPHFVIDAPGGGGKIPLLPNYNLPSDKEGFVTLRNYENKIYHYYDE